MKKTIESILACLLTLLLMSCGRGEKSDAEEILNILLGGAE